MNKQQEKSNDQRLQAIFNQAKTAWIAKGIKVPNFIVITDKDPFCPGPGGLLAFTYPRGSKMIICMNTQWNKFNPSKTMQTILHELGHAIGGNWNHSDNPNDVMYSIVDGHHVSLTENDLTWGR